MPSKVIEVSSRVMHLEDTVATRAYPFTRETLDQIQDIRHLQEKELFDEGEGVVIVPAPVVIAEAIDMLHTHYFYVPHAEE